MKAYFRPQSEKGFIFQKIKTQQPIRMVPHDNYRNQLGLPTKLFCAFPLKKHCVAKRYIIERET